MASASITKETVTKVWREGKGLNIGDVMYGCFKFTLPTKLEPGSIVSFDYTTRTVKGVTYNNITPGTVKIESEEEAARPGAATTATGKTWYANSDKDYTLAKDAVYNRRAALTQAVELVAAASAEEVGVQVKIVENVAAAFLSYIETGTFGEAVSSDDVADDVI